MTGSGKSRAQPANGREQRQSFHGRMMFAVILRKLGDQDNRYRYVAPGQLARALRESPGVPLPPEIHDYLCDFLEGKIKVPPDRPSDTKDLVWFLKKSCIPARYEELYWRLKRRDKTVGLQGCEKIRNKEWWQGPPSERAARMIAERLHPRMGWRSVLNVVSKARRAR